MAFRSCSRNETCIGASSRFTQFRKPFTSCIYPSMLSFKKPLIALLLFPPDPEFFLLPIQIWIHARFFSFLRYFQFPISLRRVINRKILKKPVKRRIYLMGIQRFISCPESLFSLPTRSADANAAGYRNSSSSVTW